MADLHAYKVLLVLDLKIYLKIKTKPNKIYMLPKFFSNLKFVTLSTEMYNLK